MNSKSVIMKNSLMSCGLAALLLATACDKDDNKPTLENEEELITTVRVHLEPLDSGSNVILSFIDPDGDGPVSPTIENGVLQDSTDYNVAVEFLNASKNPPEDITEEVRNEGTDHQLFFVFGQGLNMDFEYQDTDSQGKPIGLKALFHTYEAGSGDFRLILRHQPNKSATGVSEGTLDNAGGDTDVEVTFTLAVQ